jgi:hypothetical protein
MKEKHSNNYKEMAKEHVGDIIVFKIYDTAQHVWLKNPTELVDYQVQYGL